jgi:hypothetical protein
MNEHYEEYMKRSLPIDEQRDAALALVRRIVMFDPWIASHSEETRNHCMYCKCYKPGHDPICIYDMAVKIDAMAE